MSARDEIETLSYLMGPLTRPEQPIPTPVVQVVVLMTTHPDAPHTPADRLTAARLAQLIPDGPTRRFLTDIAAGHHTNRDYKEGKP